LNRALDVGSASSEPVVAATDGSDHAAAAEEAASVLVFEAAVRCSSWLSPLLWSSPRWCCRSRCWGRGHRR